MQFIPVDLFEAPRMSIGRRPSSFDVMHEYQRAVEAELARRRDEELNSRIQQEYLRQQLMQREAAEREIVQRELARQMALEQQHLKAVHRQKILAKHRRAEKREQEAFEAERERQMLMAERRRQMALAEQRRLDAIAEQHRQALAFQRHQEAVAEQRRQALAAQKHQRAIAEERRQQALAAQRQQQAVAEKRRQAWAEHQRQALAERKQQEAIAEYTRQKLAEQQRQRQEALSRASNFPFELISSLFGIDESEASDKTEKSEQATHELYEDPDVSVPEDDDDDIYSTPPPARQHKAKENVTREFTAPFPSICKPVEDRMDIDEIVNGFVNHLFGSRSQDSAPSQPKAEASEPSTPRAEEPDQHASLKETSSPAPSEQSIRDKLKEIKAKVNNSVETYERLFSSESSSDSESKQSVSALTSRIKVLQKAQIQIEQMYTQLDALTDIPQDSKKLRHDLISKSVSVADKIDDLIRVLETHRTQLIEKEQVSSAAESETESESESSSSSTKRKFRDVTIETIADESDY